LRPIIYTTLLSTLTFGSLLDFTYLQDAKDAYSKGEYQRAGELYGKIESDEAKFNQADALYRQKKYSEAIELYNSIQKPDLEFQKLHNIGNCYANLKKLDKAISSYEGALKLKEDKDTRFNLELLKKQKKQQEQKKQNKKEQNKDNKEKKDKQDKQNQQNKQDKEKKDNSNKEQKENQKNRNGNDQNRTDKQKGGQPTPKPTPTQAPTQTPKPHQNPSAEQNRTQPPISNMEERKWQKMLNRRGVNTLMLPLNKGKGGRLNEENPW